ncbi:MAG: AIR synthase-related protein, partial [Raoultibacter sp.]
GNVSFYNESFGSAIYPTPAIGTVGVMEDYTKYATPAFKHEGDTIFLIGETADELGGSEYIHVFYDENRGACPACDLELERDTSALVRDAVRDGVLASAHDISEGGAAVALAECCIAGALGAAVAFDDDLPAVASLFAETQARFIVSVENLQAQHLIERLIAAEVPYAVIGEVVSAAEGITIEDKIQVSLDEASSAHRDGLEIAQAG